MNFKRHYLPCLFACLCAPSSLAQNLLELNDHSSLQGELESFTPQAGLKWKHASGVEAFVFPVEMLGRVQVHQTPFKNDINNSLIQFNNGDALIGKIVSFTPERLVVDTLYAGQLSINPKTVRGMAFGNGGKWVDGLGLASEWEEIIYPGQTNRGIPIIKNGKLEVTNALYMAREVSLPSLSFNMELTIDQTTNSPDSKYVSIEFCQSQQKARASQSLYKCGIRWSNNQLVFSIDKQSNGIYEKMGEFEYVRTEKEPMHLSIEVDATTKTISLVVNGKKIGKVVEKKAILAGPRVSLSFSLPHATLSDFAISAGKPSDINSRGETDLIGFSNQDESEGHLLSIQDGKAKILTDAGELTMPLTQLGRMEFSSKNNEQLKGESGDRVFMDEVHGFHFKIDAIGDGKIKGHSDVLGSMTLDLSNIQNLVFNGEKEMPRQDGSVWFSNKDVLHNSRLLSYQDGTMEFSYKQGKLPLKLKTKDLSSLNFGRAVIPVGPTKTRLQLNNGDVFYGQILEFTPEKTVFETKYAGTLTFASKAIYTMEGCQGKLANIINDLGKIEDWEVAGDLQPTITNRQTTLTGNQYIGRDISNLRKFRLDLTIPMEKPSVWLGIFKEEVAFNNQKGYWLTVRAAGPSRSIVVSFARDQIVGGGAFSFAKFDHLKDKSIVTLVCDLDAGAMAAFINGTQVAKEKIPADFAFGKYLAIGNTTLSGITLSRWNGSLDMLQNLGITRIDKDTMVLDNNETHEGKLLAVKADKASFQTEKETMDVPIEHIQQLVLSKNYNHEQVPATGDIKLFLSANECMTLGMDSIKNGKLTGHSETLGQKGEVDLNVMEKIIFNPETKP